MKSSSTGEPRKNSRMYCQMVMVCGAPARTPTVIIFRGDSFVACAALPISARVVIARPFPCHRGEPAMRRTRTSPYAFLPAGFDRQPPRGCARARPGRPEEQHQRLQRTGAGIAEPVADVHRSKTDACYPCQKVPFWFCSADSAEPIVERLTF